MKVNNPNGFPLPVVEAVEELVNNHPVFDNDTYSVTELLKCEKQIVQARRNADKLAIDVDDSYSIANGTGMHKEFEAKAKNHPEIYDTEVRFEIQLTPEIKMSGAFDLYDKVQNILIDYKNTKSFTFQNEASGKSQKWLKQLYMYCLGIEQIYGVRPKEIQIVAGIADQSAMKAEIDSKHPQHNMLILKWTTDDLALSDVILEEMEERAVRCKYLLDSGEEPTPCSYGDCMCDEVYKVKKTGASKSKKNFDNETDARSYRNSLNDKDDYRIIHTISNARNCRKYCSCRAFCKQGLELAKMAELAEDITDNEYIPF